MKKFCLLMMAVLVLVACSPESRTGEKSSAAGTAVSVKNELDNHKYKMKLKEFKVEDVSETLEKGVNYTENKDIEYGYRYVFDNGTEAAIGNGSIIYYPVGAKYSVYYLNSNPEYNSETDESAIKVCNDLFEKIGLTNMKLLGTHQANVDTIIDRINNGEDVMTAKDGSTENIREKLKDIKILKFGKSVGDLTLVDNLLYLNNEKQILTAQAKVILEGDKIIYIDMEYIPEEIISKNEVNIISEEKAREILVNDYNKSIQEEKLNITKIELLLGSEPLELIKLLKTSEIEYSPVYRITIEGSYEKGGEVYNYTDIAFVDAVSGKVIRWKL